MTDPRDTRIANPCRICGSVYHYTDSHERLVAQFRKEVARSRTARGKTPEHRVLPECQCDDCVSGRRIADLEAELSGQTQLAEHTVEQCDSLRGRVAELEAEVSRLRGLLNRDKTGLAAALGTVKDECRATWWITEGRGSYEWDDDRYKEETLYVLRRILDVANRALRASGVLAHEAFTGKPASEDAFEPFDRGQEPAPVARERPDPCGHVWVGPMGCCVNCGTLRDQRNARLVCVYRTER